MATRSRIGIELQNGSILSVYHHWDGYPSWLGRILETHYNTKEKVSELIDGGDMSSCWSDTVWGQERTDGNKYGPEYYSDRGENCPPRLDEDMKSSSLIMKNTLTSSMMVTGLPMTCTSGKLMWHPNL